MVETNSLKESERLRAIEYRQRNKDAVNERDRKRWHDKKRYIRRKNVLRDAKCAFCQILLASVFVGMKRRRYCNTCMADPLIRKIVKSLYMKRWYHKKHGLSTVQIVFPLYDEEVCEVPG